MAEAEDRPRTGRGRGVLAGHEEGDHDMRNLLVRKGLSGLVNLVRERREHVLVGLRGRGCVRWSQTKTVRETTHLFVRKATLLEDTNVELAHLELGDVATLVRREGEVREHKVLRRRRHSSASYRKDEPKEGKRTRGVNPPSRSWYRAANDLSIDCLISLPWRVAVAVQMVISLEDVKASICFVVLVCTARSC